MLVCKQTEVGDGDGMGKPSRVPARYPLWTHTEGIFILALLLIEISKILLLSLHTTTSSQRSQLLARISNRIQWQR
jgi:hypothetical protein